MAAAAWRRSMRPLTASSSPTRFTLGEDEGQFAETFPVNSERVDRQQGRDITVIVGNPPYSASDRGRQRTTIPMFPIQS